MTDPPVTPEPPLADTCTVFGNATIVKLLAPPRAVLLHLDVPDAPPPTATTLTEVTFVGTTQLYVPGITYAALPLATAVVVDRLLLDVLLPYKFVAYTENE